MTTWSPASQIAQAAAAHAPGRRRTTIMRVHALIFHFQPLAVRDARGCGDWWWNKNPPARSSRAPRCASSASPESTGEQPRPSSCESNCSHRLGVVGFHFQAQVGRLAVGAADAELLHFEAAVEFDHGVEDLLHDVRVDQVALGLHALLQWKRFTMRLHTFGLGGQITDQQDTCYWRGNSTLRPGNRRKSRSLVQSVAPCSIASAAR